MLLARSRDLRPATNWTNGLPPPPPSSARAGESVRYLGSLLMRTDEVVLCLFQGSETTVRKAAEQAEIPFERILQAARSPWSTPDTT